MSGRPSPTLAMAPAEREDFLAGTHVGIVVAAREIGHAPLASPVWYRYDPGGDLEFVTAATSEKAAVLGEAPMVTFLVQDEAAPQRFVAVEGRATVVPGADEDTRRAIAGRYLPAEALDGFIAMTPPEMLVTVRVRPRRWRSSDFGKLAG